MFDKKVLGNNIKREREKVNLTQSQLAEKIYVTFQAVSGWERGVTPPEIENICKLAEIFNISVDELLFGSESDKRYFAAIDGGGTKTEFVLFTENGEVINHVILSDSNPNCIGAEKCSSILLCGLEILRENTYKISAIFAGLAGGISSGAGPQIVKILQEKYGGIPIFCEGDTLNVLGFAPDPMNAMGIICGTGSNVFYRKNGQLTYVGGWGYLFDNGGSGFDIARDAIREVLSVSDGLKPGSDFTRFMAAEIGETKNNLGALYKMNVHGVAGYAPLVFRAAESGDDVALAILDRNASRIAELIRAAKKASRYTGLVIGGGGLLRDTIYRNMIQEKADAEIMIPALPPICGAAAECCLRVGLKPQTEFYSHFKESYVRKGE